MVKVIVYGIYGIDMRRKIESFIDDDYCIVGYSDSYLELDILDGKPFIKKEDLCSEEFDFIVLAIKDIEKCKIVCEDLQKLGVEKNRIIIPHILINNRYMYQKDIVNYIDTSLDENTEIFIFGLSYSLRGILKSSLKRLCFDFSWHGLDMYYNMKLFEYASIKKRINLTAAILVLPYYFFNYDMSLSKWQYTSGQILSVSQLHDFHNANEADDDIRNYLESIKMFSKKYLDYYSASENIYDRSRIDTGKKEMLGHVWSEVHKHTIAENKVYFDEFITNLHKVTNRIIIIIPPFYCNNIENLNVISIQKEIFYSIVNKYDIEIYDMINDINNEGYYADATHLNYEGAKFFTQKINELL